MDHYIQQQQQPPPPQQQLQQHMLVSSYGTTTSETTNESTILDSKKYVVLTKSNSTRTISSQTMDTTTGCSHSSCCCDTCLDDTSNSNNNNYDDDCNENVHPMNECHSMCCCNDRSGNNRIDDTNFHKERSQREYLLNEHTPLLPVFVIKETCCIHDPYLYTNNNKNNDKVVYKLVEQTPSYQKKCSCYNSHNNSSYIVNPMNKQQQQQQQQIQYQIYYIFLLICYIGLNVALFIANIIHAQSYIEQYYYNTFHYSSFYGVFIFTLVEAYIYISITQTTSTVASSSSSSSFLYSYQTILVLFNVMSTFGIAILFSIDPKSMEAMAHYMEYSIQITISIVNVVLLSVQKTTTTKQHKQQEQRLLVQNQYRYIEWIIALCVVLLSILTLLVYCCRDIEVYPSSISILLQYINNTVVTIFNFGKYNIYQQDLPPPEHTAHTLEFITEIFNGSFILLFTYITYMQLITEQQQQQHKLMAYDRSSHSYIQYEDDYNNNNNNNNTQQVMLV